MQTAAFKYLEFLAQLGLGRQQAAHTVLALVDRLGQPLGHRQVARLCAFERCRWIILVRGAHDGALRGS